MGTSPRTTGRLVGTLLLLQLAGLIVPFVLLRPLTTGSHDHLVDAAAASSHINAFLFAGCHVAIAGTKRR